MNATLLNPRTIETVEPHESTILVRINPAALSACCLQTLRMAAEPTGQAGDTFREWLRECVIRENGRRLANDDEAAGMPLEVEAWLLHWHKLNDDELRCALSASYSWLVCDMGNEVWEAFYEIHAAVVGAACTRLHEVHTAIETSRRNRSQQS